MMRAKVVMMMQGVSEAVATGNEDHGTNKVDDQWDEYHSGQPHVRRCRSAAKLIVYMVLLEITRRIPCPSYSILHSTPFTINVSH